MVLSDSAEVMETVAKKRFLRKSPFLEFCDAEGLPVITGYGVEDLRTVPLSHWQRLGGPAAYCHLWISEFPARKGESGTFNFYSEVCSCPVNSTRALTKDQNVPSLGISDSILVF